MIKLQIAGSGKQVFKIMYFLIAFGLKCLCTFVHLCISYSSGLRCQAFLEGSLPARPPYCIATDSQDLRDRLFIPDEAPFC